jgi:D-alanyl-D-alanine carboxypeptidase
LALLLSPLPLAIGLALLAGDLTPAMMAVDAPPAAAPTSAQPVPAPTETEGPPSKTGPRPLLGVTPRPGPSPDLPKPPKDAAQRREWLKTQLDDVFGAKEFAKAKVSAIVVDADTGKTLYARAEKTPLNAASNVKIVTSASAL